MELVSELTVKLIGCEASDDGAIDGSFEHNYFKFHIVAPLFVFREIHQYHVDWSYTEEVSKELDDLKFYVPSDIDQQTDVYIHLRNAYYGSYAEYEMMIEKGIPKEVARICLSTGIYSSMYVTCNAHSLMSFLSLWHFEVRKHMWEVDEIAQQMEEFFRWAMPLTHHEFVLNGRVSL